MGQIGHDQNTASRRSLQAVVAILSFVPIGAGAAGVIAGPDFVASTVDVSLDSHFRYLSGVFLALGLVFLSTVPRIERRTARFRLAAALVVCGGLARLLSLVTYGTPAVPHIAGLALELLVVPILVLWQWYVARSHDPASSWR